MPLPRLSVAARGAYKNPALMNRQVAFYSAGPRNPADGSTEPASAAVLSWAEIEALSGQELDRAQQIAQTVTHLVSVPWQPGITSDMTIGYVDGAITRIFEIQFIEDVDEQRWFLKIYCAETGQNAGQQS